MEIIITPDPATASREAARFLAAIVRKKPEAVLGLATGSTPVPLYRELIRMHLEEGLDFSGCTSFNLDEYVGLGADHPASYRTVHAGEFVLFDQPAGRAGSTSRTASTPDIPAHCAAYEKSIAESGGIDVQVLGIGSDGHVGFNEPTSSLASRTRIKTLTQRTRSDNAHFFDIGERCPPSRDHDGDRDDHGGKSRFFFWPSGKTKPMRWRELWKARSRPAIPPRSSRCTRQAKIYLDEKSASKLARRDYYRWVFDHKPGWQRD